MLEVSLGSYSKLKRSLQQRCFNVAVKNGKFIDLGLSVSDLKLFKVRGHCFSMQVVMNKC